MGSLLAVLPAVVGLLALLAGSAFFSGSETALMSLTRVQVKRLSQGSRLDRLVVRLLGAPERLLGTVLVGNMLVNTLLTSLSATLLVTLLPWRDSAAMLLNIGVVTPVILLAGEMLPKVVASMQAPICARIAVLPLLLLERLLWPVLLVLRLTVNAGLRFLGVATTGTWQALTPEELHAALAAGKSGGATDSREYDMLKRILRLSEVRAKEIQVPRTDIVAVPDHLTLREALDVAKRSRFSRLPIYHGDADGIWGILVAVELTRWFDTPLMERRLDVFRKDVGSGASASRETSPVCPALFAPETARCEGLLNSMRQHRQHLMVLVNEYGGTTGILTLNDLLEEIVGRIASPGEPDTALRPSGDGAFMALGALRLRELAATVSFRLESTDAETIGGLLMERLGRLPRVGDCVAVEGLAFEVKTMAGRRVGTVRVAPLPAPDRDQGGQVP